jgi:hypothetical protein
LRDRLRRLEARVGVDREPCTGPMNPQDVAALDMLAALKRDQLVSPERWLELASILERRGSAALLAELEARAEAEHG